MNKRSFEWDMSFVKAMFLQVSNDEKYLKVSEKYLFFMKYGLHVRSLHIYVFVLQRVLKAFSNLLTNYNL